MFPISHHSLTNVLAVVIEGFCQSVRSFGSVPLLRCGAPALVAGGTSFGIGKAGSRFEQGGIDSSAVTSLAGLFTFRILTYGSELSKNFVNTVSITIV